ncbi:hypothetical protein FPOAC2_04559 [Fusarium poae]
MQRASFTTLSWINITSRSRALDVAVAVSVEVVSFRLSLGRSERFPSFLGPSERGINSPSSRVACCSCSLILCFPPTSCCSSFPSSVRDADHKASFLSCYSTELHCTGTLLLRRPKLFPWDPNINTSENSLYSTSNKWLRALY